MNTLKLIVIVIIVAAVPIFGLQNCFLRDENGDRIRTDPNTGLIYHDDPFEKGQMISFGCQTNFKGINGICILEYSTRHKRLGILNRVLTSRLTEGTYNNGIIFERMKEDNPHLESEYCTVSIRSTNRDRDNGNWTLSEVRPGQNGNWVRLKFRNMLL